MLCLLYHVKDTQFLVDTSYVVEIIHRVNTVGSSVTPHENFDGLINYRGQLIPLLDFCFFYSGERAEPRIHSRIIILESIDERQIGLLAEGVIRTVEVHRNDFLENRLGDKNCAYISGLWNTPLGIMKNVDIPLLFDICHEGASYG